MGSAHHSTAKAAAHRRKTFFSVIFAISLVTSASCATAGMGGRRGLSQYYQAQYYQPQAAQPQVAQPQAPQPQAAQTQASLDQMIASLAGTETPAHEASATTQQGSQYQGQQGAQKVAPQGQYNTYTPQAAAPAASGDAGSTYYGGSGDDILSLHNQYRAAHNAPPLAWSTALVSSAQNWANGLAGACNFYHSGMQGVGENLAAGYRSWAEVAGAWYQEINQYSYSYPGFSEATGHATQMLWASTTELGCAAAASSSGCWEGTVYVCHYNPPGNVAGEFQQNVM